MVILNIFLIEFTEQLLYHERYCYHDIKLPWQKILSILPTPTYWDCSCCGVRLWGCAGKAAAAFLFMLLLLTELWLLKWHHLNTFLWNNIITTRRVVNEESCITWRKASWGFVALHRPRHYLGHRKRTVFLWHEGKMARRDALEKNGPTK